MKYFHLSDLHIGKTLHHYSLKEEQEHVLNQVVDKAAELHPDAILIAGDIYDKSMPSAEAVDIFDDFLTKLTEIKPAIPLLIISGNHDSGERLDFASGILKHHQVYLSGKVPEDPESYLRRISLNDDYGTVHFYLLPFIKPAYVKHLWPEEESKSYHNCMKAIIEREQIDYENERNVLLSHQFYVNGEEHPETSESETISVGGLDHIDISTIKEFDYVALGHLHRPQKVGEEKIRYCGTLLKYSVSEADHNKSMTVVELGEKGQPPVITTLPLETLRDVKKKTGTLEEILAGAEPADEDNYISIVLTDEKELYMPKEQLANKYNRILEVRLENRRFQEDFQEIDNQKLLAEPLTVFAEFYETMRGQGLSTREQEIMQELFDEAKEGEA